MSHMVIDLMEEYMNISTLCVQEDCSLKSKRVAIVSF
jgi:hypothetical protein